MLTQDYLVLREKFQSHTIECPRAVFIGGQGQRFMSFFHTFIRTDKGTETICYGSVKMIRFSYSNEDTKDDEEKKELGRCETN